MFCSIVFFTRANMVGVWLLFSIVFLIISLKNKNYKFLFNYSLYFLVGFLFIAIPLVCYFIKNNILYDMLFQAFYVNFKYASGSGIGFVNIIKWLIYNLLEVKIILIILLSNLLNKINKELIIYNFIFLFITLFTIISKRDYGHYLIVIVPFVVPYLSIVAKKIIPIIKDSTYKLFVFILGMVVMFSSNILYTYSSIKNNDNINSEIVEIGNYIKKNTTENDRIYSHNITGAIYLQSERLASTKYFFIPAIDDKLYADDFKKIMDNTKPTYIVIEKNYSSLSELDEYVISLINKSYVKEKSFENFYVYKLI